MLIAVDAGKHTTKAIGTVRTCFRTKVDAHYDFGKVITGNNCEVEYEGNRYLIGEDAAESDYDTTKLKDIHRLSIYTAIALLAEDDNVQLATGCPITEFFNSESREKYRQFLHSNKPIAIKVNGVNKRFTITDINIFPESIGVVYREPEAYINKLVGIIDIGGLNSSGAVYERLNPRKDTIFTISEGGNMLNAKITRELNVKTGGNYHDYEIPYLMTSNDKEIKNVIDNIMRTHIAKIIETTKRYDWNTNRLSLIFTGGGSLLLEKYIKEQIPDAVISKDAVWDNVQGFYNMEGLLCRK